MSEFFNKINRVFLSDCYQNKAILVIESFIHSGNLSPSTSGQPPLESFILANGLKNVISTLEYALITISWPQYVHVISKIKKKSLGANSV